MTLAEVRLYLQAERNHAEAIGREERAEAMRNALQVLEADPEFHLPERVEALAKECDEDARTGTHWSPFNVGKFARRLRAILEGK